MKQKRTRKLLALVMALCLIIPAVTVPFTASAAETVQAPTLTAIDQEIAATAQYIKANAALDPVNYFYRSSLVLIMLLRSGINCTNEVNSYLSTVSTSYTSGGTLSLASPETDYAYLAMVLTLSGHDPENFNGTNIITKLEASITSATQSTLNAVNPYMLPYIYNAVNTYSAKFSSTASASACLTKVKNAIISYGNSNGINYWGNSSDNNGFGLAGLSDLSKSDATFKALVDSAVAFNRTLTNANGASAGDFTYSPDPNADSTAASLILYSEYGYADLAAASYAALLTFKTSATPGAFSYTSASQPASFYAASDALQALINYKAVLIQTSLPTVPDNTGNTVNAGTPATDNTDNNLSSAASNSTSDSTAAFSSAATGDVLPLTATAILLLFSVAAFLLTYKSLRNRKA